MIELAASWIEAKNAERAATERRREIEDRMAVALTLNPTSEGSSTVKIRQYKIRVTTRFTRRIDSDLLQDLAAEHGLSEHLGSLFRWKPELNLPAWQAADASITTPLAEAIVTRPGRPSFTITEEEHE